MTTLPDDRIDPYEPRLARRVDSFAEQAVRPIDPLAIAAAAHAAARRQTLAGRLFGSAGAMARFGVVLAGALVAAAAFGVYLTGGAIVGPTPRASVAVATPTATPGPAVACAVEGLSGAITAWEGAAGHRIATVRLSNDRSTECLLAEHLRPALIDATGRALMVGKAVSYTGAIPVPAGAVVQSFVDMANYCGAEPKAPLKIRLYLEDRTSIELLPTTGVPLPLDPPPCNGSNAASEIQMQALQLAPKY